jgi:hypothetical protein
MEHLTEAGPDESAAPPRLYKVVIAPTARWGNPEGTAPNEHQCRDTLPRARWLRTITEHERNNLDGLFLFYL